VLSSAGDTGSGGEGADKFVFAGGGRAERRPVADVVRLWKSGAWEGGLSSTSCEGNCVARTASLSDQSITYTHSLEQVSQARQEVRSTSGSTRRSSARYGDGVERYWNNEGARQPGTYHYLASLRARRLTHDTGGAPTRCCLHRTSAHSCLCFLEAMFAQVTCWCAAASSCAKELGGA